MRGIGSIIEMTGIEIVPESEGTAKPWVQFWFAANIFVFGVFYGSLALKFGISSW